VRAAAILLVGTSPPAYGFVGRATGRARAQTPDLAGTPIACLDILGCSILQRTMARLAQAGITSFSVLADAATLGHAMEALGGPQPGWPVEAHAIHDEPDIWPAIGDAIGRFIAEDIPNVFLVWLGDYVEFVPEEVLQFSRNHRHGLIHLHDRLGPTGVWLLSEYMTKGPGREAKEFSLAGQVAADAKPYLVDGYVNRLSGMRDLRRFVTDVFASRCAARPRGKEMRPGIWTDDGAKLHRQARIVPPAYIGKSARISAATLITRASSIERDCTVDHGTVVENSSVLAGTYVGTGLDVIHSVVSGNTLVHLRRDLAIEIHDEVLIRANPPSRLSKVFQRPDLTLVKNQTGHTRPTHSKGVL
jgi:NDP-sugar pyrophosphorylase family protein